MSANTNLHKAKTAKSDEFYTQIQDVENELSHYKQHFAGKVVFCNCDDPTWSAFWRYFHLSFEHLGLKKLISTHYDKEKSTYKMEYEGGDDTNIEAGVKTPLIGNGDFRNQECLDLLDESDIVVTNPPFSRFITNANGYGYVNTLIDHKKKFIIIGNRSQFGNDQIFSLIRANKLWIGYSQTHHMLFQIPPNKAAEMLSDKTRKRGHGQSYSIIDDNVFAEINACFFTNLDIPKRHEDIILWAKYSPDVYPRYDGYDAIEVNKTANIPVDYFGIMGVPITFLEKYNPEQFEIIGKIGPRINGKPLFTRILIRRKGK